MTRPKPKLSEQQLTALTWAAGGVTAEYGARQMRISLTAFNGLLFEARRKLDAANTTHAVALAYQQGYLTINGPGGAA